MKLNKHMCLGIVVLLLFPLLQCCAKTYSNEDISFQYPSDWSVNTPGNYRNIDEPWLQLRFQANKNVTISERATLIPSITLVSMNIDESPVKDVESHVNFRQEQAKNPSSKLWLEIMEHKYLDSSNHIGYMKLYRELPNSEDLTSAYNNSKHYKMSLELPILAGKNMYVLELSSDSRDFKYHQDEFNKIANSLKLK